ncbi:MAG: hypothetical protein ACLRNT_17550, partial [[Clostridium] innocuum]
FPYTQKHRDHKLPLFSYTVPPLIISFLIITYSRQNVSSLRKQKTIKQDAGSIDIITETIT